MPAGQTCPEMGMEVDSVDLSWIQANSPATQETASSQERADYSSHHSGWYQVFSSRGHHLGYFIPGKRVLIELPRNPFLIMLLNFILFCPLWQWPREIYQCYKFSCSNPVLKDFLMLMNNSRLFSWGYMTRILTFYSPKPSFSYFSLCAAIQNYECTLNLLPLLTSSPQVTYILATSFLPWPTHWML